MEKTLLVGDFIIVSKINFGPRVPNTPLTVPFSHQTMPFTTDVKSYLDWIQFPYFRLPGFSSIKNNDVVVFNYPLEDEKPIDHRTHFVKRCIALPGDTLQIIDKIVFINSDAMEAPEKSQFTYNIKTGTKKLDNRFLEELEINEGGQVSEHGDYQFALTKEAAGVFQNMEQTHEIKERIEKKEVYNDYLFPFHSDFPWNIDHYGPLVIPKAGDSIEISVKNLPLYQRIISNYENNLLETRNDSVFINGNYTRNYIFKMNYYFMMGDSRHHSSDSRYWGFVPEDHIVGKAIFILFSVNKNAAWYKKLRWDRLFFGIK